ncbi:MAG TPA: hypothetical protein VMW08_00695 [Acidimicrobiales bacterium]|nr:hypothetical protein [Acidimicrobiales bacterium]
MTDHLTASGGYCAPIAPFYDLGPDRNRRRDDPDPPRWRQKAFWTGSPAAALADALAAERYRDMVNYDLIPTVEDLFPVISAPRGGITYLKPPDLEASP